VQNLDVKKGHKNKRGTMVGKGNGDNVIEAHCMHI
jgi:hypothetical protein